LRWGVLGVSELVGRKAVLPALQASPTAELIAVASRDLTRAQVEAKAFGAGRAYGTYGELLQDADLEAVYIPLPNALHALWTIEALEAGLHVLCEKPLACTAEEARRMAAAAEKADHHVLMEAYMAGFHPRLRRAIEMARGGALGKVLSLSSAFTFPNRDPANYRWLAELGGGALLDVGVNSVDPLLAIAGEPLRVAGRQVASASGVDASFSGWLEFAGDVTASIFVSFDAPEHQHLTIIGTEARLDLDRAFTAGPADRRMRLSRRSGEVEELDTGGCDPYVAMVEHFAAVVRGEAASQRPPLASVRTLEVLDRLRAAATQT
jgi:xylose dehydrogenase (NAD/NADP)